MSQQVIKQIIKIRVIEFRFLLLLTQLITLTRLDFYLFSIQSAAFSCLCARLLRDLSSICSWILAHVLVRLFLLDKSHLLLQRVQKPILIVFLTQGVIIILIMLKHFLWSFKEFDGFLGRLWFLFLLVWIF